MSSPGIPWSDNPNTPRIPYRLYTAEKEAFAGGVLGAIFYGFVIGLFFRCIHALFNHRNRKIGGIRWKIVIYTVIMFSFVTVYNATYLDILSVSFINYRDFPGGPSTPPGPVGYYQYIAYSDTVYIVADAMFLLNTTLSDGLLLYRCYVIYSRNYKVIIFPCLMYIATIAMGISSDYELAQPDIIARNPTIEVNFGLSYFSISFTLNILLTFMIVIRLFLHNREIRKTMEVSGGPYMTVAAIIIESSALYAVTMLLFFIPWAAKESVGFIFYPLVANVEVIAAFLIILRVANRGAFSSGGTVAGSISSIKIRNRWELTSCDGTLPAEYPSSVIDRDWTSPGEMAIEVSKTVELYR